MSFRSKPQGPASIALCHEWLRFRHGSEKTFEQMARVFPQADIYALTRNPESGLEFDGRQVHTTMLDRIRPLRDRHALQLPLMPLAMRLATRKRYDVVVTSSHACAKGFSPGRRALHLCYCYTPMRYVWKAEIDQRRRLPNPIVGAGEKALKAWDLRAADCVDEFAAISHEVAGRIESIYRRPAKIIYPPVDTDFYTPGEQADREDFAVAVARLVPYKRLDLAIEACARLGMPLKIAGWGPQEQELRRLASAAGGDVEFATYPTDYVIRDLYRRARLCLFPAEEDFGIVPVEAQACGTPVVALDAGGSRETVQDGFTGALIPEQTVEAMVEGIERVLDLPAGPAVCRANAEKFSAVRFREEIGAWVEGAARTAGLELGAAPVD